MWIIGLDLSLNSTGVCILRPDGFDTQSIKPDKALTQEQRIDYIIDVVSELVFSRGPNVNVVFFIEGYSFTPKSSSMTILAELAGSLKYSLRKLGHKYQIIPPTTLKKFVTGKGSAKKEQMLLAIYKKWGVEFKTNDEADAFALAQLGDCMLHDQM